ncbi:hypothetical protein LCGC14_2091580 [marine sediment metagenome]|uniref:Uncharacterized protein n=1 Tax=marine sediment metagenome TaxID=412755 RepID=A0A0F9ECV6_9ZZZZ|nr:hypothetical protein [bacterium]
MSGTLIVSLAELRRLPPLDFDHDQQRAEYEPCTNVCPDCEGAGKMYSYLDDLADTSISPIECERCEGVGELFE